MEIIRSWLIAPANRRDYIAKFPQVGADCVVMDLEDGTPEPHKVASRARLPELVRQLRSAGLQRNVYVRVNHPRSEHYEDDVREAAAAGVDGIAIPKLGTVVELQAAIRALQPGEQSLGRRIGIIGGIESALGLINVTDLAFADERMVALYFGAEDYATDLLGARRTREGLEVLYARSRVVVAAKAARIGAIDQGVLEVHDDQRFREDAEQARNLGFDGKVVLNPRQVMLANQYFAPSPDEIDLARRLLAAAREAEARGIGTINFEGRMVDGPLIKRSERILSLAQRAGLA